MGNKSNRSNPLELETAPVRNVRSEVDRLLEIRPYPSMAETRYLTEVYVQLITDRDLTESKFCRVFTIATALIDEVQGEMRVYRLKQIKAVLDEW